MHVSAILIINAKGEVVISRYYRSALLARPRTAMDPACRSARATPLYLLFRPVSHDVLHDPHTRAAAATM